MLINLLSPLTEPLRW